MWLNSSLAGNSRCKRAICSDFARREIPLDTCNRWHRTHPWHSQPEC
jgi:hypothetical protein